MVTLNRRFNLVFILLVALPISGVCLLLSWLYMNALLDTVSGQTQELQEQIAENVDKELNSVTVLAATLLYDKTLGEAARVYSSSRLGSPRIAANWQMTERLNSIFNFANRTGAIVVYLKDNTSIVANNYPNIQSFVLSDKAAFREAKANPGTVVIADSLSGLTDNGSHNFILSALVCPKPDNTSGLDAILVMFRLPYLDQLAAFSFRQNTSGLLIIGRDGKPLLKGLSGDLDSADLDRINRVSSGRSEISLKGHPYFINAREVRSANWKLLLLVDKAALVQRITNYQWYVYPAIAAMLGLFLLYSMIFFARVTRPIQAVIANMQRFASGSETLPVATAGIAELGELAHNFEWMVGEISRLDRERAVQGEQRLAAEIRALQFQINPHFVANTLNSIRMMAIAAHNEAIREMAQALIRILADSYASAEPFTTLKAEVENLRNYLYIMKVRFGEHFLVKYELSPASLDCRILRMSLQPLVENAILHGFADLPRQGLLEISAWPVDDSTLKVTISDNGAGMSPERLRQVRGDQLPGKDDRVDETFNRIGVHNVHDRIRLHFGDPWGLAIESQLHEGTTVTLTLPLQRGGD